MQFVKMTNKQTHAKNTLINRKYGEYNATILEALQNELQIIWNSYDNQNT